MLAVAIHRQRGDFVLDVSLEIAGGTTCAVVGESGAGKSTLLRVLAGVLRPDRGRIALDGAVWCDIAAGVHVDPWTRAVGYVPQDYALFPHLTLLDNVAFGLRTRGARAAEARERARAALEPFGLAGLAGLRPAQLSGGQQQRGALARALVTGPTLLLLDEPLSALDRGTRAAALDELERVLAGLSCVTLYVTHSEEEAERMGERVVRMERGGIAQD